MWSKVVWHSKGMTMQASCKHTIYTRIIESSSDGEKTARLNIYKVKSVVVLHGLVSEIRCLPWLISGDQFSLLSKTYAGGNLLYFWIRKKKLNEFWDILFHLHHITFSQLHISERISRIKKNSATDFSSGSQMNTNMNMLHMLRKTRKPVTEFPGNFLH